MLQRIREAHAEPAPPPHQPPLQPQPPAPAQPQPLPPQQAQLQQLLQHGGGPFQLPPVLQDLFDAMGH